MKFDIFKIKAIPRLFWSSPKTLTIKPPIVSFAFLILGLIIFGLGEALLIAAGVGVSPWTVFAQGFSIHTGWSIGVSTAVFLDTHRLVNWCINGSGQLNRPVFVGIFEAGTRPWDDLQHHYYFDCARL